MEAGHSTSRQTSPTRPSSGARTIRSCDYVAAIVAMFRGDLARATTEADAALALNPNYALAHGARGTIDVYVGNPLAAIPHLENAHAPRSGAYLAKGATEPFSRHWPTCTAGKYETAAVQFRERILLLPGTDLSRAFLASALGHLGRLDEARAMWAELKADQPSVFIRASTLPRLPFKQPADMQRIREGLTKAGLPPIRAPRPAGRCGPARSRRSRCAPERKCRPADRGRSGRRIRSRQ